MQTARRQPATRPQKAPEAPPAPERRARRGPKPATIGIILLLAALGVGGMLAVLLGYWPPPEPAVGVVVAPTPTDPSAVGLEVKAAGAPRREGDQVILPVVVTNSVEKSPEVEGTPTANVPTPTAGPALVRNGTVKVVFFSHPPGDPNRVIVGSGVGNVIDLAYGQSKVIDIVATDVGQFCNGCYEVWPDTVWTDKDPDKPAGSATPENRETPAGVGTPAP